MNTDSLTDREKHLVGLAVTVTRGCTYCTGGRIKRAIESGVSREAIVAAIDLAAAVGAGVTIRTALLVAEQTAATAACSEPACIGPAATSGH
jgi:AhpD family alkylhydroperoxidase